MKLALCFSGQPRFTEECSGSILANVIQKHDVDVFAHLWFDEDLQTKPYKFGGTGSSITAGKIIIGLRIFDLGRFA